MALPKATTLGVGLAAVAIVSTAGFGFAPPAPSQVPLVEVHHNPT